MLWESRVEDAEARFSPFSFWRGIEAEASLSFAGLSELLDARPGGVGPTLPGPRHRALEVALLLVEPGGGLPIAHAIGLALVDVLRVLAERGPVLVALDDVQWLDTSSAAVLQIALRRLRDERVSLLRHCGRARGSRPFELERSFSEDRLGGSGSGRSRLGAFSVCSGAARAELTRPELAACMRRPPGIRSSRSSSDASWCGRTPGRPPGRRCRSPGAWASYLAECAWR